MRRFCYTNAMSLLSDLLHFREECARREGIESFKVLSKANLDAIAFARPRNKEELTAIKGIKEAKYKKYGQGILALVAAHTVGITRAEETGESVVDEVLSVDAFLEALQTELSGLAGRVRGEVTDINSWQQRVVFFSLKDSETESVLKCSMSYQNYLLTGAPITAGTEVVVEGFPRIYKPRGELSFSVSTIELFGEGALKKAYDELYKKIEAEGGFDPNRKKPLPKYPERVALITSLDGAALGDFQTNIGRFGLHIDLYPSGVEGNRAIHELMSALKAVKKRSSEYDILVLVRGGGSLESLAAFNNEALVREILHFPLPVIAGIGHEKDVTLAALVSDQMESTPTACALRLTSFWALARESMYTFSEKLPRLFENRLFENKEHLSQSHHFLFSALADLKENMARYEQSFVFWLHECQRLAKGKRQWLEDAPSVFLSRYGESLSGQKRRLDTFSTVLAQLDPKRVLALGYSLVRKGTMLVRDSKKIKAGDILAIQLGKGKLSAEVKTIE